MTLEHRTTRLIGGPLAGANARITPDEPTTLTLCLGALLPDWRPAGWVTYHRHPDGTYRWPDPVEQETPVKVPSVAADGLTGGYAGEDPPAGVSDALRSLRRAGFRYEDIDPPTVTTAVRPDVHDFDQDHRHTLIRCCAVCGKWPMHHNHTGITTDLCSCDMHQMPPIGDTP